MPTKMTVESRDICTLHVSGTLKRAEFGADQETLAKMIDDGGKPRVLAVLDNFEGWERDVNWDDFDFLVTYSDSIAKIAIVGDAQWETKALAFAGAGVRGVPVRFFPPGTVPEARAWLVE